VSDEIFDPNMDPDAGDASLWQPVVRSTQRRRAGVVLSVRVDPEIAAKLEHIARRRGVSMSVAARDALYAVVQQANAIPYGMRLADLAFSAKFATTSVTMAQQGSLTAGGLTLSQEVLLTAA
jgi:hypothetical protein